MGQEPLMRGLSCICKRHRRTDMMRVKIKENNESRNTTTTFTDDGELTVALDASTTYFIDITFTFDAGATPDFKYQYVYTGTVTNALFFEGAQSVLPLA